MNFEKQINSLETQRLLEVLREYIPEITEQLTRTSGIRPSLEKQLRSLFDAFEEYTVTRNIYTLSQILENWLEQYTESDTLQILLDLASWLYSIEKACISVIQDHSTEFDGKVDKLFFSLSEWFFFAQENLIQLGFKKYTDQQSKTASEIQSMLEKLDRSKSNFISIAAHELKTPLTLIEGYSMMLSDLLSTSENITLYTPYLQGIRKGTDRLKQIIQDMIDVSLIDSRMLLLIFQPCLLNRLIETVVEDMKKQAVDRDLLIQWRPIQDVNEMIYLDEIRISQALRNVIENAIKYTPDGGRVSIYGRKLSGFVEIMVEDTGIGVDPEDQSLIFEKFSQLGQVSLHSTGKSKFKGGGAGLGLPIAKGILEAHGGTIWMESEGYDEVRCPGSIFHLMVPIYTQPPEPSKNLFSRQL
ncbi:MAG: HAMP domain-containing histidine kinase [Anaerolineales bacterium]|nr:HAMP domain-containing histidine kinase [Anaerolineales bacterium]